MLHPIAVRQVDVSNAAFQAGHRLRFIVRQDEVRYVDVRANRRMCHVPEKIHHLRNGVYQRKLERLQFERDLKPKRLSVLTEILHSFHGPLPLLGRRNDLLLPDILAEHQQQVFAAELITEV